MLYLIDQHFKLNEKDGAVYGLEHLLAVTMKGHQLEKFIVDWDLVLAGVVKKPEGSTLEVLFLRQLRTCNLMNDDIREYDKFELSDANRSYAWLKRAANRVIERRRLQNPPTTIAGIDQGSSFICCACERRKREGFCQRWKRKWKRKRR